MRRFLIRWKQKLFLTLLYLAVIGGMWLLKIPCVFQALFHVACPGCGMTRAYLSLLRGDLMAAFAFHPMFWSVPLVYAYLMGEGELFGKRMDGFFLWFTAVGFFLQWIPKIISGF